MTTFSTRRDGVNDSQLRFAAGDAGQGMWLPAPSPWWAMMAITIIGLIIFLLPAHGQLAPAIAATKTYQLVVDNNSNAQPDPGDTLKFTVVISNFGTTDALGVVFSDLLDTNTTLISGSVMTTPLARDDNYSALGNVQISIAAPGVLANDIDPDGIGPALTVTPYTGASTKGGDVALNADGSFTYNPPPGFEGSDTFPYTLNDNDSPAGTDTATVFITVSGMIWFVNSAAAPGGDGRLTSPFNALTGAGSFNTLAASDPGDNIFVYSGSYAGGLSLKTNQKLIGQGATASLVAITGLTPPSGSLPFPATGGGRPTVSASGNNLVLSTGNLVRGLNLSNAGGTALLGVSVGNLAVTDTSVTNTAGVAINLAGGDLAATFTSVSSSGGANGIKLVNTTGSFAVTGLGPPGSGGAIQNTIGADGSADGCGVYLSNASGVSLTSMALRDHPNFAIRGTSVTGFNLLASTVEGVNGTSAAFAEGSLSFSDLLGAALISGCNIAGGLEDNVRVTNGSGALNRLTLENTTFGANSTALGDDSVLVEASGTAVLNVTVSNCVFTSARGDLLQCNALNNAVMNWVIVGNAFSNSHPSIVSAAGGTTFSGGGAGSAVTVTYDISNNTFRDAQGIALNVFKGTGGGNFSGTISNNTIGVSGVTNSGSAQASGLQVTSSGTGNHTTRIEHNTIYRYNENGIYVRANDGASTLNATILNNTIAQPDVFGLNGLQVNLGAAAADANFACLDIRNNTLAGSGPLAGDDFNLRQRFNTTIKLPGYAGAANDSSTVIAFVQGNNLGLPDGAASVSGRGGGFQGGSPCVLPLLAAVDGAAGSLPATAAVSAASQTAPFPGDNRVEPAPTVSRAESVLDEKALSRIIVAAKLRWQAAGLTEPQLAAVNRVTFELTELGGWCLGASSEGHVQLDRAAAGRGWFIDPTPEEDAEFNVWVSKTDDAPALPNVAAGRIDLLTTVLHELGHAAGLADLTEDRFRNNLMYGSLTTGERRVPAPGQAAGALPGAIRRTQFVFTPLAIGTLPAGKSITITFLVTINKPWPAGVCQLVNQGNISGANFGNVLTDDPAVAGANDPTITFLNAVPTPTIAAVPANVCTSSSGNTASGPPGYAAYAWTISNGTITSPVNQPTITYTAGAAGNVTLGLTVFNASGCGASTATNVSIIMPSVPVIISGGCSFRSNYFANQIFTDGLGAAATGLAFDGTNYWSCSGGSSGGVRFARYDAAGGLLATFSPGLDFRSVFTDQNGNVLARAFNDATIYRQTGPGIFVNSGITLTGGTLDLQSSVVLNGAGTEFIAMSGGVVSLWSTNGTYLGNVSLQGFGAVSGENSSPQNRGIAAVGGFWLTYSGNGVLSVWDTSGNRVMQSALAGAGVNFDSAYSFSYCNGKVFVVDASSGPWRGYDVCSGEKLAVYGAPGVATWNTDVQTKIQGAGPGAQVDAYLVTAGNPVPTLADLRRYQAVLVYSDAGFNNNTNLGNALADYMDQGGGVVLGTFAYYNSGGLSIQGRLATGGYLPFTPATQNSGFNLTLIPDLPLHPILAGVASFNGGTSSYHNSPLSLAAGATLIGHWSNGQPLVGTKEPTAGRLVGLNFYPPSSDALGGGWVAGTDGARIMANSLLWAGRCAPTIVTNPVNQIGEVGSFVTYSVAAVGGEPLSYQWRRDRINLPGQTASALTVEVQPANVGNYSVVVANPYGRAFSASASLGSRLRFLPFGPPSAGGLPIFLGSSDNCPLTAERAAHIRIYATTNVALPFASWSPLPDSLVLSNGYLRLDILDTKSSPLRFFRAVESP